ncbi:hydroxymethylglutaryl-CoA reductase, degradative [Caldiplasma sukawensis]
MVDFSSRIEGFRNMTPEERRKKLSEITKIKDLERELGEDGRMPESVANNLVENFTYKLELPVGIATNFVINGEERLIPMAIEEPSVIAACSNAAKIVRETGGFTAISSESLIYAQVQITKVKMRNSAKINILQNKERIIKTANTISKTLSSQNRGLKDLWFIEPEYDKNVLVLMLTVDVGDAMGANIVNSMAETIAPLIEELTGGEVVLRILSNLTPLRITRSKCIIPTEKLGGKKFAERFMQAAMLSEHDVFRASTHNKGIMNGIDAVLLATMNDWRQAEANAHSYASLSGKYKALTHYTLNEDGNIEGYIEIPLSVGTVGGTIKSSRKAQIAMEIMRVKDAKTFCEILASVGLAQNFAAMRALAMEGIQKGHMSLHSRNVAIRAGAIGDEIEMVAKRMVEANRINTEFAEDILKNIRSGSDGKEN